jgi:hypothetical protein
MKDLLPSPENELVFAAQRYAYCRYRNPDMIMSTRGTTTWIWTIQVSAVLLARSMKA